MTYQLQQDGAEYEKKVAWTDDLAPLGTFFAGLFDDAEANVGKADDLAAVEGTEPQGGAYARPAIPASDVAALFDGGHWYATAADVTFDVSDSSRSVSSWFLGGTVQLDGDNAAADHLFATGALGGVVDLSTFQDTVTFDELGVFDTEPR